MSWLISLSAISECKLGLPRLELSPLIVNSLSAIDYIQFLIQQKKKQEDELDSLRKEVMALKIMKA